jgi:RNA polymerase sigma-70 factor (ECF subfamily)
MGEGEKWTSEAIVQFTTISHTPSGPAGPALDDATLALRMAERNPAGMAELYDRYGGVALGLATRMLQDPHAAQDAVQESFLQAWRRADSFDPQRGSLRSWLLSIVHHRCIDILRQHASRPRNAPLDADVHQLSDSADTWAEVEQRLSRSTLLEALAHLSAEQREAITLGYFGGYTHVQIAERLGLPLGTVKGRLRLGLQHLRALLTEPEKAIPA